MTIGGGGVIQEGILSLWRRHPAVNPPPVSIIANHAGPSFYEPDELGHILMKATRSGKALKHVWDCVARARREHHWGTMHKLCPFLYAEGRDFARTADLRVRSRGLCFIWESGMGGRQFFSPPQKKNNERRKKYASLIDTAYFDRGSWGPV